MIVGADPPTEIPFAAQLLARFDVAGGDLRPTDVAGGASAPGNVDVWRVMVPAGGAELDSHLAALPEQERARAARYLYDSPRRVFVTARATLRSLLGRALGLAPAAIRLTYGPHGRPELAGCGPALHFNVSHSGNVILLALSAAHELGVDVERVRTDVRWEDIARRSFSTAEAARLLDHVPTAKRPTAFFRCWTRKEAYLKAKGAGLSFPLSRFDVTLAPEDPPRLLRTEIEGDDPTDWLLADVDPCPGYLGALIVQRSPSTTSLAALRR